MFRKIREITKELEKDNPFGLSIEKSYRLKTDGKIHKFTKVENGLAYFISDDGKKTCGVCGASKWGNYFELVE